MSKQWQAYAHHILDAIQILRQIQQRGDLTEDRILYDAALRNLQTLSEATQRLPDEVKRAYDAIPWTEISGFRNILVHNYLGDIDPQTVLAVLEHNLAPLKAAIDAMLAEHGDEP